jgi:hypothetical protein
MTHYLDLYVGKRAYIMFNNRAIYAEWDGTKWNKLPWPTRR